MFSLRQALLFIFGCKFYENLFAVCWGEALSFRNGRGHGSCLFIIPQMYGKKDHGKNKGFFFNLSRFASFNRFNVIVF